MKVSHSSTEDMGKKLKNFLKLRKDMNPYEAKIKKQMSPAG